jgi:hypothetical protein
MAAKSPTFFERLTFSRSDSPILPFHTKDTRRSTDYDLDELEPRPEDRLISPDLHPVRMNRTARSRSPSVPEYGAEPPNSVFHALNHKHKVLFAGPPPPIAASIVLPRSPESKPLPSQTRAQLSGSDGIAASNIGIGSVLVDRTSRKGPVYKRDSIWRSLQRREAAIEKEFQHLLDLQADGLIADGDSTPSAASSDRGVLSDTGSNTPTGTFYSTATSKSRMMASLDPPIRATSRGEVIPIRQPKRAKPLGLRGARSGLRKSMVALAELKVEEDAHIGVAIAQRRKGVAYVRKLSQRRNKILSELDILEKDEEEPLGKELRDLSAQHESLSAEIREMEEKLVGMRNRRNWVEAKMDDVKNRREAGLSGYRGALKEVERELTTIMKRPPISPLDIDAFNLVETAGLKNGKQPTTSPGGDEFMSLLPERRTADMAKDWWQGEIEILEKRKATVAKDRQALEEGAELWQSTIDIVTGFEADLRQLVKGNTLGTGKGNPPTQEAIVQAQLPRMGIVITELEDRMQVAEEKHWNLLICAIGAELEAFKEAEQMLRESLMDQDDDDEDNLGERTPNAERGKGSLLVDIAPEKQAPQLHTEESDNEVPPDLLVSHVEDQDDHGPASQSPAFPVFQRMDSENEIPPEFLTEHRDEEDVD